jgi:hypothetical protein
MTQSTTSVEQSGPLSAGSVPSYANEGDPSWEEVIAMVVIPGQPGAVRDAAGAWELLFSRIEQVRSALDQLGSGLQSWEGAAGEAYRAHLSELSTRVTQIIEGNRPVVQLLNTAADNIHAALANTPIPNELVDEAMAARDRFQATGVLNTKFHPGYFLDLLFPGFLQEAGEILGFLTFGLSDKASDMLRDFLSNGDDQAKAAYHTLSGQHQASSASLTTNPTLIVENVGAGTVSASLPTSASIPSAGPGTGTFVPPASAGVNAGPTVDPTPWTTTTGTSLAGAGGSGGLTSVGALSGGPGGLGPISAPGGPGAGGLGAGRLGAGGLGAGGVGTASLGAGGIGAASAGGGEIGMATGLRAGGTTSAANAIAGRTGGGAPMMGGVPGGAGAGRGGARGAGKNNAGGVASTVAGGTGGRRAVPMGGAGGEAGQGSDYSTWLQEDEDVWGSDSDAAPPVVG